MHFHDCIVRVVTDLCFEKQDNPNLAVRGFSFIDDVERLVEAECPGVVSSVGVIVLVARDALVVTVFKSCRVRSYEWIVGVL
ncbi:hypothetical protein H5410_005875 [Solanum commersonii]|uniref:peroxidase n=1 Tax=Solanum commersonii TaxID=4109 RepID=A0A9J6A821_SOLCO|nr:hypothetical protein H5410_005875 [Solanum commersonii]